MAARIAEFKYLSADDLLTKEKELDDRLFRLRIQKSMGQLEAPLKVRTVRRDLAALRARGLPITGEPGPGRGVRPGGAARAHGQSLP